MVQLEVCIFFDIISNQTDHLKVGTGTASTMDLISFTQIYETIYYYLNSIFLHMDLVGMLTKSVKAAGLHMGLYHSLFEWFKFIFSIKFF